MPHDVTLELLIANHAIPVPRARHRLAGNQEQHIWNSIADALQTFQHQTESLVGLQETEQEHGWTSGIDPQRASSFAAIDQRGLKHAWSALSDDVNSLARQRTTYALRPYPGQ